MPVSLKNAPAFYMYDKRDGGYYWECPALGTRGWRRANSAAAARVAISKQLAKAADRIGSGVRGDWK